jgi:hypothetical protein
MNGYAVNKYSNALRSVDSAEDVLAEENYSATLPLALAPTAAECIVAIQEVLDSVARAWGYDSLLSAASYLNSTVVQFKADALALTSWRDASWQWAYAEQAGIGAGTQTSPKTLTAFITDMPTAPTRS